MSGTQDLDLSAQNPQDSLQTVQAGLVQNTNEEEKEKISESEVKEISSAQKMDELIRNSSSKYMKKEIEKLRKEAAKYRTSSKEEAAKKQEIQIKADEIQTALDKLKTEHRNICLMRKLDKAGCIKSELVVKDIPQNLDADKETDDFISTYKEQNAFLFTAKKQTLGSNFKVSKAQNLTSSQQMDAYIRAALGR